jgi:uncharacterized protein YegL
MRRLPIFFVIDVSESMVGGLENVDKCLQMILGELNSDPYALETAFISTIVFAGKAMVLNDLQEVYTLTVPKLPLGGGTDYGEAFDCLMREIDRNVVKSSREQKGDWKPLIFFFTDGNPTSSSYKSAFKKWDSSYAKNASVIGISLAAKLDYSILGMITEQLFLIDSIDQKTIKDLAKWVSVSIKTTSVAIGDGKNLSGSDAVPDEDETVHRINLKKDNAGGSEFLSNNDIKVIIGKCSKTSRRYVQLFTREGRNYREKGCYVMPDEEMYDKLTAGKNSGDTIDTSSITGGMSSCPHCNNPVILTNCSCGKVFCSDPTRAEFVSGGSAFKLTCPWCGHEGLYQNGNFDAGTGLG